MAAMWFVQFVCIASCIRYTAKLKKVGEINIYQAKNDFIAIYYSRSNCKRRNSKQGRPRKHSRSFIYVFMYYICL